MIFFPNASCFQTKTTGSLFMYKYMKKKRFAARVVIKAALADMFCLKKKTNSLSFLGLYGIEHAF